VDWSQMLFQDWQGIVRTLLVGAVAYALLVLFLRLSGKRTLAKLNAFDLVVTVAIGSTLSAVLLQESIALAEGAAALALLIGLQYLVASLSVRSRAFARLVRSEPSLVARDGAFCDGRMRDQRLTADEVLGAVRANGGRDLDDVEAVILESDGSLSVILKGR
jgi:Predicted membrane protein